MEELSVAVVGIDYPNADKSKSSRRMELLLCPPGEPVELRLEPHNEYDEHAIAVFSARGVQVGYVPSERAPYIGKRLKSGEEVAAIFQAVEGTAGYVRVRFDGGTPTLPALGGPTPALARPPVPIAPLAQPWRPRKIDPDAFYPDPDGPEWGA